MKAHKVTLLIIDHDDVAGEAPDALKNYIEQARYPNHCLYPHVKSIETRDIGEWDDDHPLNKNATHDAEYQRLFG